MTGTDADHGSTDRPLLVSRNACLVASFLGNDFCEKPEMRGSEIN